MDSTYTGEAVSETVTEAQVGAVDASLIWTPARQGIFFQYDEKGEKKPIVGTEFYDVKITRWVGTTEPKTKEEYYGKFASLEAAKAGLFAGMKFYNITTGAEVSGKVVLKDDLIAYKYDNVVVPQKDLPRIKAEMKSIPLVAKAYFIL